MLSTPRSPLARKESYSSIMFGKLKSAAQTATGSGGSGSATASTTVANGGTSGTPMANGPVKLNNPITQFFEIGNLAASAGPELVWKIYDAIKKNDNKDVSVWVFEKKVAEKLHKPRRKETVTEILRAGVKQLERWRHPRLLSVIHAIEESAETLAFASEPVLGSLTNILQPDDKLQTEYRFLDVELKYGLLQITEGLAFLHSGCHLIHRNICPSSVIITKRGTWKLAGLEFTERLTENSENFEVINCQAWSSRLFKMAQPDLDFIAPEIQTTSKCTVMSDMFSMGMLICSIFNQGKSLIEAHHSNSTYIKQLPELGQKVKDFLTKIPLPIQDSVMRLTSRDSRQRPIPQILSMAKYFSDPAIHALQFLDVINMKDPTQKSHFYRNTLMDVLPLIPKKLWFRHVYWHLSTEMKGQEVLAAVLRPTLYILEELSKDEVESHIWPGFKFVFGVPKTIQASVTLLENLHVILKKAPEEDIENEVLPFLYSSFESSTNQVQSAALVAVTNISNYLNGASVKKMIFPRIKTVFENNTPQDISLMLNILSAIEKILDKMERPMIIDEVLPLLCNLKLQDPDVIVKLVFIYRRMLTDKKYGLSVNLMATKVMPLLLPQTVNPSLNLEQFNCLMIVLQDMMDHIERQQRNKLKLDMSERRPLFRHQHSSDNVNAHLNIPNLRIETRKTSSAEDFSKCHSNNSSMSFLSGASSPDANFLRVHAAFTNRRLSDNVLLSAPKNFLGAGGIYSTTSSPGTMSPSGGLPMRRHSSFGTDRRGLSRRGSLSPMTGFGMQSVSSTCVPTLISPRHSLKSSRRPSMASITAQQATNLMQQLGSNMVSGYGWQASKILPQPRWDNRLSVSSNLCMPSDPIQMRQGRMSLSLSGSRGRWVD